MSGLLDRFHLVNAQDDTAAAVIPTIRGGYNILGDKHHPNVSEATMEELYAYIAEYELTSTKDIGKQTTIFDF